VQRRKRARGFGLIPELAVGLMLNDQTPADRWQQQNLADQGHHNTAWLLDHSTEVGPGERQTESEHDDGHGNWEQ
jgi:hypothetical protein